MASSARPSVRWSTADRVFAGADPADRGRAARRAAHHLGHRGAVIPRLYGRMRMGGNIIWATDFREGDEDHDQGRRQGRRGRQGQDHRVSVLRQLCGGACARARSPALVGSGPTASRWTWPASPALVSRQRDPDGRPVHRGEDGRPTPCLSRHRLCRLRGTGARNLRQPPAAAVVRSLPPAGRSRHRRGADPRRHHDPGLGRVHLCHRRHPQRQGGATA